jgi:hypothetical protein
MDWQFKVGIAVAIVFGLLPFVAKDIPQSFTWAGITAAVLFGLWGIPWANQRIFLWSGLLIILGFSLLTAGGVSIYQYWPPQKTELASTEPPLTIALLWRTDFNVGSYKMLQTFSTDLYTREAKRLGRFDFGVGMYGNFDSKSLFMSLYVPASEHGYDLIGWFADGYRTYLDDARKNIHIWIAPKGDLSQPISDDLIFTNRIYIYYENILADARVNELTNLYRSKGLEPVFRGFGYLEHRRLRIAAGQEKMPTEIVASAPPEGFALPFIDHSVQFIDGQKLPSLLSLFMTDFKGVGAVAGQWIDITLQDGSKEWTERVQLRVYNDIHKHFRFIAYYIPPSAAAFAIVKFLAPLYANQMNDLTRKVATAKEGENVSARAAEGFAENFPFSGTVYVYLDNSLSEAQIAESKKLYSDHGADIQFRDFGYAIEIWNQIKTGKVEMPPEYRLTDEFPQPVTNEKQ